MQSTIFISSLTLHFLFIFLSKLNEHDHLGVDVFLLFSNSVSSPKLLNDTENVVSVLGAIKVNTIKHVVNSERVERLSFSLCLRCWRGSPHQWEQFTLCEDFAHCYLKKLLYFQILNWQYGEPVVNVRARTDWKSSAQRKKLKITYSSWMRTSHQKPGWPNELWTKGRCSHKLDIASSPWAISRSEVLVSSPEWRRRWPDDQSEACRSLVGDSLSQLPPGTDSGLRAPSCRLGSENQNRGGIHPSPNELHSANKPRPSW